MSSRVARLPGGLVSLLARLDSWAVSSSFAAWLLRRLFRLWALGVEPLDFTRLKKGKKTRFTAICSFFFLIAKAFDGSPINFSIGGLSIALEE